MISHTRTAVLGLLAIAATIRCSSVFPPRDDAGSSAPANPGNPGQPVTPVVGPVVGRACYAPTDCKAPSVCQTLDGDIQGVTMCTHTCAVDADCEEATRCTDVPNGRVCTPRCTTTAECTLNSPYLRCIGTPSGDGVCWTTGAKTGEVATSPKPLIDRVQVVGGAGDLPWIVPGATVSMSVSLVNGGTADLKTAKVTLVKKNAFITVQSGESGTVPTLPAENPAGIVALTTSLIVAPNTPYGEALAMELRIVEEASQQSWTLPFEIRAFRSPALVYIMRADLKVNGTPVAAVSPGTTTTVTMVAANLGFASTSGVTATVTSASATASWSGGPFSGGDFPAAGDGAVAIEQELGSGSLTLPAGDPTGTPVMLHAKIVDAFGGQWDQDLTIPGQ